MQRSRLETTRLSMTRVFLGGGLFVFLTLTTSRVIPLKYLSRLRKGKSNVDPPPGKFSSEKMFLFLPERNISVKQW